MGSVPFLTNLGKPQDGSPIGNKNAADSVSYVYAETIASDAVEAGSTTRIINATAHQAKRGDLIRFTSGALDTVEVRVTRKYDANTFYVELLDAAPSAADTFDILRSRTPLVDPLTGGTITSSGPIQFTKDGVATLVNEDTAVPANNDPLPVKLSGVTGDINITAGDLNVHLSHAGGDYDSTRLGDGTNLLDVVVVDAASAGGETGLLSVAVANDADGDVVSTDGDYGPLTITSKGRLRVDATISEAATAADGAALPAVTKVISGYDGANVQVIHTDAAGDLQVDLASSIPAGTNNIGDVDVLTEPATAADASAGLPASSKIIAGYDGANVRTVHTDASGDLQVDLASALPAGTNIIGQVNIASSFVPTAFDEVAITYVTVGSGIGQVETAVFKLATVTVKTLTLSYDGSDRLSGVVAS